jgi:hypothetical protein
MNPLLREDLMAVIATACNDVFTNRGESAPNYYKQYLKEFKSESAQLITLDMAYFGETPVKKAGAPIEYDTLKFGNFLTIEAISFALGFKLTREAIIALQKKPYGEFSTAKMANVTKVAAALRDSANHTRELIAAQVILQSTSTTKTAKYNPVGRDGLALASGAHKILKQPGTVWSNSFGPSTLSQSSLGTMIQAAMTIPSDEGFIRRFSKSFKLLVGPNLLNRAYEVTETKLNLDSANQNVSVLNQFKIDPVVVPYLQGTNLFALQTSDHQMGYFAPVDDTFEEEEDFETKGHRFSNYFQYVCGYLNPYGYLFNAGL